MVQQGDPGDWGRECREGEKGDKQRKIGISERRAGLTTAFPTVVVSAHAPTGYDAFSMFAPVIMTSSAAERTAQPTRNWE